MRSSFVRRGSQKPRQVKDRGIATRSRAGDAHTSTLSKVDKYLTAALRSLGSERSLPGFSVASRLAYVVFTMNAELVHTAMPRKYGL